MSNRRQIIQAGAALGGAAMLGAPLLARAQQSVIKIGYSASKTGPGAGGNATQNDPVYTMWFKEIEAAGGITVKGKKYAVEKIEYDDRSNPEEAIRAYERLATQDKVDFVFAPWGTGMNLAVAPTLNKYKYPHLAVSSITDKAPMLVKRWNNIFFHQGGGSMYGEQLVNLLEEQRKAGKIGNKIAMVSIADEFGVDLSGGARKAAAKHGFQFVYDKTYPGGTQDFSGIINDVKGLNPDAFVAFSYPPDSIGLTATAQSQGFNPKVYFVGIGTAFPMFVKRFGPNTEGIMGVGGVNADNPNWQSFFKRHVELTGKEPDRFSNMLIHSTLNILKEAIERAGTLDRAAVIEEIRKGSFNTPNGVISYKDQQWSDVWCVGQWLGGEFHGLAPVNKPGAKKPVIPKPAWKAV